MKLPAKVFVIPNEVGATPRKHLKLQRLIYGQKPDFCKVLQQLYSK